jgi:Fe-S oxidoreductase
MEELRKSNNLHLCFHGAEAPCACLCPFGLDVRSFLEKMQRGSIGAAFRQYRNTVVFPGIVSKLCPAPCKSACLREATGGPLSMPLLERACIDYTRSTDPDAYNLPKKEQRIAVVGAGISGLACALKFAINKYNVTIYERSGTIGGALADLLPAELYIPEIEKQFSGLDHTVLLNTNVQALADIEYDAVYLSAGVDLDGGGEDVFRCPRGLGPMGEIAEGINALHEIEWYLKTGHRRVREEKPESRPEMPVPAAPDAPLVLPENGESYTKDEAKKEAGRCLRCDCSVCMQHCDLLQHYDNYPDRLKDDVDVTMNPNPLYTGRIALRQINSCNFCGLCKKVCPVNVDVGDYLLRTRRELFGIKALPPAYHEYWLRDMEFANSEKASLTIKPDQSLPGRVFFPGCQIGGSDPRYVTETYRYLLGHFPDTALFLRCCGVPALWAGDTALFEAELGAIVSEWEALGRPELILACPSCMRIFKEYLSQIPCRMVYDVMLEQGGLAINAPAVSLSAAVFDPCSSRDYPELQQSIRALAREGGFVLEELPHGKDTAQCCSWGGQIYAANPGYAQKFIGNRVGESALPYIAYCTNCRDIFTAAGKQCLHILDILFGLNDFERKPPTQSERRKNRVLLRRRLVEQHGKNIPAPEEEIALKLIMDDALRRRVSSEFILEEDIGAVIEECEKTGRKLVNRETNHLTGHLQRGIITYWVEYEPREEGFEVFNAYCHRMMIQENVQ